MLLTREGWGWSLTLLLLFAASEIQGKGTGYSSRSGYGAYGAGYGGSVRTYRSGAYSPYSRYYVYPMIWYHPRGHVGRTSDPDFEKKLEDVFCKRVVTTAQPSHEQAELISKRSCYHQNGVQPGDPQNKPLEGIFIDVLRYTIMGSPTPDVKFEYFSDQTSMTNATYTYSVKFTKVLQYVPGTNTIVKEYDLSTILEGILPAPASVTTETSRIGIFTMKSRASSPISMTLSFALSDDFVETEGIHDFYRPSALKVKAVVTANTTQRVDTVLEYLVTTKGKASSTSFQTAVGDWGATYNPPDMDKVDLGLPADKALRQRGYISFRRTVDGMRPCTGHTGPVCVSMRCQTAASAACGNITTNPDTFAVQLSTGPDATEGPMEFLVNLGYYDATEDKPAAATSLRAPGLIAILFAAALVVASLV